MKARNENGKIVIYESLPTIMINGVIGTTLGGYEKLSDEIHKMDGFYEVIIPHYNELLQYLGNIYFNEELEYFTYPVLNKNLSIENEKIKKIQELKKLAFEKFSITDWYYIRNIRNGAPIPSEIVLESDSLYQRINEIEIEINNLNDMTDVLNYEINLDDTE